MAMNENFSFFHILTKIGYDQSFHISNFSGWAVVSPSGFKTFVFLIIADEDHLLYPYLPFSYLLWEVCCLVEF